MRWAAWRSRCRSGTSPKTSSPSAGSVQGSPCASGGRRRPPGGPEGAKRAGGTWRRELLAVASCDDARGGGRVRPGPMWRQCGRCDLRSVAMVGGSGRRRAAPRVSFPPVSDVVKYSSRPPHKHARPAYAWSQVEELTLLNQATKNNSPYCSILSIWDRILGGIPIPY